MIRLTLVFTILLAAVAVAVWLIPRPLRTHKGPEAPGIFAMIIGAIGIVVPLLVLAGDSSRDIQLAILISGAIVFGCGAIAAAIGGSKK